MARWKARSIRLESSLLGSTRRLVARSGRNRSKCADRLRVIFSRLNAANCNRAAPCAVTSKYRASWLTRMRHFSAVRKSRQRSNQSRLVLYRRLRGSPRVTDFWSAGLNFLPSSRTDPLRTFPIPIRPSRNSLSIHSPGCCIYNAQLLSRLPLNWLLRYLQARRVIVVSDAAAQIFLWRVARLQRSPSRPAVLPGCDYRCSSVSAKSSVVAHRPFAHSASHTDSLLYLK